MHYRVLRVSFLSSKENRKPSDIIKMISVRGRNVWDLPKLIPYCRPADIRLQA